MNNRWKMVSMSGLLSLALTITGIIPAFAASPEFARTSEEWAKLQDNVLEYGEIGDLIHEYNVTVQNNQVEYQEFVKDYGTTRDDVAWSYRKLADDLENSMTGDSEGAGLVSDFQLEQQAKQLRDQADDNVEDSEIYKLNYQMAEDNLTMSAQSKYISYEKAKLELESAKEQLKVKNNDYNLAVSRQAAGMATESQVLETKEQVLTQEKTIAQLEQQVENARQTMIVMLGWKESDTPEIQQIPEVDLDAIRQINLESDKQKALENNYTLRINKRKLENAQYADNQKTLENTVADSEKQIAVSVTTAYQTLQTALRSYETAISERDTENRNLTLAQQKLSAGMITQNDYDSQQTTYSQKERAVSEALLELRSAYETYEWNVNGLASA